ncbi:hypothetical protein T492DRAFT_47174 [Pavlovales sp. CCMP2436]|nr:hypothetical protein T492DRAFT_47174 [Pavlovales sp. CCMP2436]
MQARRAARDASRPHARTRSDSGRFPGPGIFPEDPGIFPEDPGRFPGSHAASLSPGLPDFLPDSIPDFLPDFPARRTRPRRRRRRAQQHLLRGEHLRTPARELVRVNPPRRPDVRRPRAFATDARQARQPH